MSFRLLLGLLFVGWLFACGEESIPAPDVAPFTEYYPLAIGNSWNYEVDSVILVPEVGRIRYDTIKAFARETLQDTFNDQSGRLWYRGLREERPTANSTWQPTQTFALRVDSRGLFRTEDNLEFQKLALPVRQDQRWDGHSAFDEFRPVAVGGELLDVYAGWSYQTQEVDTPYDVRTGASFDETVLVDQADVDNLIDFRRSYSRYAKGVGLIESFVDARHTQCQVCCGGNTGDCLDLSWGNKAEKGYIIHQVLLP